MEIPNLEIGYTLHAWLCVLYCTLSWE